LGPGSENFRFTVLFDVGCYNPCL